MNIPSAAAGHEHSCTLHHRGSRMAEDTFWAAGAVERVHPAAVEAGCMEQEHSLVWRRCNLVVEAHKVVNRYNNKGMVGMVVRSTWAEKGVAAFRMVAYHTVKHNTGTGTAMKVC